MFSTVPDRTDLAGTALTADALHAQRARAGYLAGQRGAHYLITAGRNQPGLHARLAARPWPQIPVGHQTRDKGHGRAGRRTLTVTAVAAGLAFPHAAQAIQIARRRRPLTGKNSTTWPTQTACAITSLTAIQAKAADLARFIRGHRGTDDRLHRVRDVTYDQDRSQVRTGSGPRVMASQPGHRHRAADRPYQHRRRLVLSRPPARSAATNDHPMLTTTSLSPGGAGHSRRGEAGGRHER